MKRLMILLLSLMMTFMMNAVPVLAADVSVNALATSTGTQTEISPQAEETVWVVRYDENGNRQRRLWSITYGRWMTDWLDWPE